MKPYYQDNFVTVYHGDMREVLPTLGRFDLLLTDPPYGLGIAKKGAVGSNTTTKAKHGFREYGNQGWDITPPNDEEVLSLVASAKAAIVWGGNYFQFPATACWLIWDKCQRDFSFADAEMAWTNLNRAVRGVDKLEPGRPNLLFLAWKTGSRKRDAPHAETTGPDDLVHRPRL